MKKAQDILLGLAGLVMLAALGLGLAAAFRALSEGGVPGVAEDTPRGYPPPQGTSAIAVLLLTPSPGPLFVDEPQAIYDPAGYFSLRLLPGWRAWVGGGATVILNYDDEKVSARKGTPPPNWLKIQISAGPLKPGQSFDQWLSEWRTFITSPESGAFGVTLTEPQPYKLGRHEGVAYFATDLQGGRVLEIDLPWGDGHVMVIGLSPSDSSALPEALLMLSAIEFPPKPLP